MTAPDHRNTYKNETETYDRLISREDYQGNLTREIVRIQNPDGLDILDLGAGTGRLSSLLAGRAGRVTALDLSPAMLEIAAENLRGFGASNFLAAAADHRALPLPDDYADMVVSGWSICYLADWYRDTWRSEVEKAFAEISRVLRPGGRLIIIETQGTGFEAPTPPPHLYDYFAFLREAGFAFSWIRTDYRFEDLKEAVEISGFFFGEELAKKVEQNEWVILPECTGFWTKTLDIGKSSLLS